MNSRHIKKWKREKTTSIPRGRLYRNVQKKGQKSRTIHICAGTLAPSSTDNWQNIHHLI